MKYTFLLLILTLLFSCDNDIYQTYTKEREFTITKIKRSGQRKHRGFYVEGFDKRVRYRNIRNSKLAIGDKVVLKYDSTVNRTKGTFKLKLQRRYYD